MIPVKEELIEIVNGLWLGYQSFKTFFNEDQKILQRVSFLLQFSILNNL